MKDNSALSENLAEHLRSVFMGGNWTSVNFKTLLAEINYDAAVKKHGKLNSIAQLSFHAHYYIAVVLEVLKGNPLQAHDQYSYDVSFHNEGEWQDFKLKMLEDANAFADLVKELPEQRLWEAMDDPKYGSFYRNIQGIIEHCHYHLGQIALLKRM